jgi:hypothetical protein
LRLPGFVALTIVFCKMSIANWIACTWLPIQAGNNMAGRIMAAIAGVLKGRFGVAAMFEAAAVCMLIAVAILLRTRPLQIENSYV